jgi:hypothetical protein
MKPLEESVYAALFEPVQGSLDTEMAATNTPAADPIAAHREESVDDVEMEIFITDFQEYDSEIESNAAHRQGPAQDEKINDVTTALTVVNAPASEPIECE